MRRIHSHRLPNIANRKLRTFDSWTKLLRKEQQMNSRTHVSVASYKIPPSCRANEMEYNEGKMTRICSWARREDTDTVNKNRVDAPWSMTTCMERVSNCCVLRRSKFSANWKCNNWFHFGAYLVCFCVPCLLVKCIILQVSVYLLLKNLY